MSAPPKPPAAKNLAALAQIMSDLRTPGTGCPWDIEQSFATIAPYTIEEAYEVADAIERGDMQDLKDELGDLLLQVVYHSQMAAEDGAFDLAEVVAGICEKMVRRHPHVYGNADDGGKPHLAKGVWEAQKAAERAKRAANRGGEGGGVLADVPANLPALSRAIKLQGRAARVGFDWPDTGLVFAKIAEEVNELQEAVAADEPRARIAEELGDVFFVLANLGRHLGIAPEAALAGANGKFVRRFAYIESQLARRGTTPEGSNLEEMDLLWDEAKEPEKSMPKDD